MDASGQPRSSKRAPELLVPFLGLIVTAAVVLLGIASAGAAAATSAFALIAIVFAVIFLGSAALVWRRNRIGYVISIIMSVLFLGLFGFQISAAITGFADLVTFLSVFILFPVLLLTLIYSILGVRQVWRRYAMPKVGRMIPASSFLALVVVGFVIGGASVGVIASGAVTSLVRSSGVTANILIFPGAASPGTSMPFVPASFTVKVGSTVTWANNDTATHTVTSTSVPAGAKMFDSGNLPYGNKFSVTFTVAGNYKYYCSIHPSMTGIIVVT